MNTLSDKLLDGFDPNSPQEREALLDLSNAPHETAAVMRMHRAGWKGRQIAETLNYRGTQLMRALQHALDQETYAHGDRRPIHDALIKKGTA
ncbi:helix-turn-helix DNA binding domain protein [Mycobacterium phage MyraDee]|uniref:Helix-turn-helix DNA binding domain protein n=1 Tax=Mycobacterium phage MyraDee TaxID=2024303 RepID=A0A222Z096_9CAUD|nr:helix-turn-helix DNA binding domain protein [Mycobacterium phage MyraDee]ASR77176.1 helix-turn-helix DNA binding domain protein [Mycobacterium phage MyraDee]